MNVLIFFAASQMVEINSDNGTPYSFSKSLLGIHPSNFAMTRDLSSILKFFRLQHDEIHK